MNFLDSCVEAFKELSSALLAAQKDKGEFAKLCIGKGIGYGGDIIKGFDLLAEEIFITHLKEYGQILSEESGLIGSGEAQIVLDPIDGSDNLRAGIPYYGTSVALCINGRVTDSFIGNIANGDYFCKNRDGFWRSNLYDDTKIDVQSNYPNASLGVFEKAYAKPHACIALHEMGLKFRSPGALALSLAYAHMYDFIIFAGHARRFDVEAGLHMCEDLHIWESEHWLLVARDIALFEQLREKLSVL